MHQHTKQIVTAGMPLGQAKKAMIMIHGRGAQPHNILEISDHLNVTDFVLIAPAANQSTWYPYSFMAPVAQNEPGLSTALDVIGEIVQDILDSGIEYKDIYFLGFSQGACLTSEYVARNANRYGGVFVYSGGVIGEEIDRSNYKGDFAGTPIFLGCSDIDAHVPLQRVQDSTKIFKEMGGEVTEHIYPNAPHTIFKDEVDMTNKVLAGEKIS